MPELKAIVEQQAAFTFNSGFHVEVDYSLPTVEIMNVTDAVTVAFMQEHAAQAFIEEAQSLADAADLPHEDGYMALAKAHIECAI